METTFALEKEDIWRYYLAVHRKKQWRNFPLSMMPALAALQAFYFYIHIGWLFNVITCILTVLLAAGYILLTAKPKIYKVARSSPGLLGVITVSISSAGVRRKSSHGEHIHPWQSYVAVKEDSHLIYFFLAKTQAQVVPRRAFASPAEAERFFAVSHAYWRSAKDGTPLPQLDNPAVAWPPAPRTL